MEPVSASAYRAKRVELFECPSEAVFKLRMPGAETINKVMVFFEGTLVPGEEPPTEEEMAKVMTMEKLAGLTEVLMTNCVLEPSIVMTKEDITDPETQLLLEELDPEDWIAVFARLLDMIGISPEGIKSTLFRSKRPPG